MIKIKIAALLLVLFSIRCFPQPGQPDFPKDTSFTVYSAWQKIKKEFPKAKPVYPLKSKFVNEERECVYRDLGNRKLHLDLFHPSEKPKKLRPAVLLIHGGGWRSGNKSQMEPLAQQLAKAGYVAVDVEYRLSAEAQYPAGIYDLKEAIKFLKYYSRRYNIDTTKIAALGCSAGATLATFLGTTGSLVKFEDSDSAYPGVSANINAVVNVDGIVDFTDPAESGKDNDPAKPSAGALWFGGTFKKFPEKWVEASPVNYADGNTPPVLFINSALPRYHAGRDEFLNKIKFFATYSEVRTIPETPHTFWLFDPWFAESEKYVLDFLEKVF